MPRHRLGELLCRMGRLSPLDVQEILTEQVGSHRRFGEIALAWGLCEPQHVCQAWYDQIGLHERVDLDTLGVDAQAVTAVEPELIERFGAVPLRLIDGQVVVAVAQDISPETLAELRRQLEGRGKVVFANARQIVQALGNSCMYHPARN